MGSSAYLRVKRFEERKSLEREQMYLSKAWTEHYRRFNAHQWAAVKRWWIFYHRRRQERESGFRLDPPRPRHWVGSAERAKKLAKARKPSVNVGLVRHLFPSF